MRRNRYEILLPLAYNDGRAIEVEKFQETEQELVTKFGALTTDTISATGTWVYKGVLYRDKLVRMRLDTAATTDVKRFFKRYKKTLKERFQQIDIWITVHSIEVI